MAQDHLKLDVKSLAVEQDQGRMSGCSQLCRASPGTSTALGSPVSQKDFSAPHVPAVQQAPSPP